MSNEPIKATGDARSVGKILETPGLLEGQLITALPSLGCNASGKPSEQPLTLGQLLRKQKWLDKWLSLSKTSPDLNQLEDAVYKFACGYAANPKRGGTIVLFGENGCGKTRTARALCKWARSVAMKLPLVPDDSMRLATAEYCHWPEVVDGFKKQEFNLDHLRDCELCIIDDIGAEHDPSGFGKEQLYLLLSRREFRWNVITTNLPPSEWDQRLERRIASRLFRNAEHIDLSRVPDFSTL